MKSVFQHIGRRVNFLGEFFVAICCNCNNDIEFKPTEKKFTIKAICPKCQTEHTLDISKKFICFSYDNNLPGSNRKSGISVKHEVIFFRENSKGVPTSIPAPIDMLIDEDISDIIVKTFRRSKD